MTLRFILNHDLVDADGPPAPRARRLRSARSARHQGGLPRGRLRRLHGAAGRAATGAGVAYRAVTSCLLPLAEVAGSPRGHRRGAEPATGSAPVQQALVDEGASQCGFCTPGIVVALTGFLLARRAPRPRGRRSPRSRATSAAAPATPRSAALRPGWWRARPSRPGGRRRAVARPGPRRGVLPRYFATVRRAARRASRRRRPRATPDARSPLAGGRHRPLRPAAATSSLRPSSPALPEPASAASGATASDLFIGAATTVEELIALARAARTWCPASAARRRWSPPSPSATAPPSAATSSTPRRSAT